MTCPHCGTDADAAESRLVVWQAAAVLGWLALAVVVVAFMAVG